MEYQEFYTENDFFYGIVELPECNLLEKIHTQQKSLQYLAEEEIWEIFLQIVRGLKFLHENNVLHRNLKSSNIFLFPNARARIGNLFWEKLEEKTDTPYYASPEVWKDQNYDKSSDIWSLGCVLYEMATMRKVFVGEDMQALFKEIMKGQYSFWRMGGVP